jgi:hypothetical protein
MQPVLPDQEFNQLRNQRGNFMARKFRRAIVLILVLGVLSSWLPLMAQETGAKNAPQKSTTEKDAPEKNASEKSVPEKSGHEPSTPDWLQPALTPVELRPVSASITLHMEDNSRTIYETIGKQAGIKVLVDPDYIPRAIRVDLNKVSLQDALTIVAAESRTFWRPVTSDTILIAQDSMAKRRELEQSIIKIFYLPNVSNVTDIQDIVNALRTLVEIQRIQQLPAQNVVLARGTPNQIAMSEKLIDAIEKAKKEFGEYRLEFRISELEREKRLNSRNYTLLLEHREIGKLRIGTRIPVPMSADAADKKQIQYLDVGQNIDCQIRNESQHTLGLNVDVDFSNFAMSDQLGSESGAHQGPGTPVLQQFRITARATLELGKPTIISSFDDPSSKRTFQIEVTANRIRERE